MRISYTLDQVKRKPPGEPLSIPLRLRCMRPTENGKAWCSIACGPSHSSLSGQETGIGLLWEVGQALSALSPIRHTFIHSESRMYVSGRSLKTVPG
jgi:hypothetical protein